VLLRSRRRGAGLDRAERARVLGERAGAEGRGADRGASARHQRAVGAGAGGDHVRAPRGAGPVLRHAAHPQRGPRRHRLGGDRLRADGRRPRLAPHGLRRAAAPRGRRHHAPRAPLRPARPAAGAGGPRPLRRRVPGARRPGPGAAGASPPPRRARRMSDATSEPAGAAAPDSTPDAAPSATPATAYHRLATLRSAWSRPAKPLLSLGAALLAYVVLSSVVLVTAVLLLAVMSGANIARGVTSGDPTSPLDVGLALAMGAMWLPAGIVGVRVGGWRPLGTAWSVAARLRADRSLLLAGAGGG